MKPKFLVSKKHPGDAQALFLDHMLHNKTLEEYFSKF